MALPFTRTFENNKNLEVMKQILSFFSKYSFLLKLEWTNLDLQKLSLLRSLEEKSIVFV